MNFFTQSTAGNEGKWNLIVPSPSREARSYSKCDNKRRQYSQGRPHRERKGEQALVTCGGPSTM